MLLNKEHLRVAVCASKDDARPLLTQVKVFKKGEEVISVATDSYVLAEVRHTSLPDEDFPANYEGEHLDEALIPGEVALKAMKTLPNAKKLVLPVLGYAKVQRNPVNGQNEIVTTDLDKTVKHMAHVQEGNYPDYEKLIPKPDAEGRISVKLDTDKLRQALELWKGDDNHFITLEIGGRLEPVVLRGDGKDNKKTVIVMPLAR